MARQWAKRVRPSVLTRQPFVPAGNCQSRKFVGDTASEPRLPVRCAIRPASPVHQRVLSQNQQGTPPFWGRTCGPKRGVSREWLVSLAKSIQVSSHNFTYLRVKRNGVCSPKNPLQPEKLGAAGGVLCGEVRAGCLWEGRAWRSGRSVDQGPDPQSRSWPRHWLWELE